MNVRNSKWFHGSRSYYGKFHASHTKFLPTLLWFKWCVSLNQLQVVKGFVFPHIFLLQRNGRSLQS